MQRISSDTATCLLRGVIWRKSRYSNPIGNCVEVAELADGRIAVRNSRHPGGPMLLYTGAEVAAFIQGVKGDEFDDMVDGAGACG